MPLLYGWGNWEWDRSRDLCNHDITGRVRGSNSVFTIAPCVIVIMMALLIDLIKVLVR